MGLLDAHLFCVRFILDVSRLVDVAWQAAKMKTSWYKKGPLHARLLLTPKSTLEEQGFCTEHTRLERTAHVLIIKSYRLPSRLQSIAGPRKKSRRLCTLPFSRYSAKPHGLSLHGEVASNLRRVSMSWLAWSRGIAINAHYPMPWPWIDPIYLSIQFKESSKLK